MDNTQRLGEDSIFKLIIRFSIPAIIAMVVTALYNIVDRIFIGNSAGSLGIAGATIGFPLMMVQSAVSMMIGIGATALLSIKLGEGKKEEAETIVGNTITLLVVVSIIMTAMVFFIDPLLRVFGASEEVLPYARDYMRIIMLGTIFGAFSMGLNNFLRAEGKPVLSMATQIVSTLLNVIFTPLFIWVFDTGGMVGAALGTVLSQAFTAVWIVVYYVSGKSTLKIHVDTFKLKRTVVMGIFTLGLSSFLMSLAQSLLSAIMNNSLVSYGGDLAVSAVGVVMSLNTLIFMPLIGLSMGVQPIIGFNYGARKFDRVTKAVIYAISAASVIGVVGTVFIRLFPRQLISIFNSQDTALIDMGSHALLIFTLFLPLLGLQIVGSGYFQAVGKPKQSIFLSMSRQVIILIPLLLILPLFFRLDGVFYALPASDILATLVTGIWLVVDMRKEKTKMLDPNYRPSVMAGPGPGPGGLPNKADLKPEVVE